MEPHNATFNANGELKIALGDIASAMILYCWLAMQLQREVF